MKRILQIVLIFIIGLYIGNLGNISVYAIDNDSNIEDIQADVDALLDEYNIVYNLSDIDDLSLESVLQGIHNTITSHITAPLKLLGIIMVLIIFSAFIQTAGESLLPSNNNTLEIVCVLSAIAVITEPLLSVYENTINTINICGNFMMVFVPSFAVICALSGHISALGTYNAVTLGMTEVILGFSQTYLLPLLTMTVALSVTNSICSKSIFDGMLNLLKKVITWTLTVVTSLFVGFVSLKNSVGSAADTFASKTAKFVISGFVPVIGGAVSDAYSTVKGSVGVLKSTAGVAGILAVILMFLPPIIEIIAFRLVMNVGSALSDMFSVKSLGKVLKGLDTGLAIALSIMICFALLFIIDTAILMNTMTS